MKRKTLNTSTVLENNTDIVSEQNSVKQIFLGDYFNIHTFKNHPITKAFIEREAMQLKEWAELDSSMLIQDFYDMRGYAPKIYYRFVDEHPEFAAADEYAMRRIGSRRELGAATRKFAETTIHKTLGRYHEIWREEVKLANEARLAIAEKSESKVVVIERFPSIGTSDVEVVSTSKLTPEEVAGNIHRNTATDRQVRINSNVGDACE